MYSNIVPAYKGIIYYKSENFLNYSICCYHDKDKSWMILTMAGECLVHTQRATTRSPTQWQQTTGTPPLLEPERSHVLRLI